MEVQEISDRLDYQLGKAIGGLVLDEYNKSLYLTKAQLIFVSNVLKEYEYGDTMRHMLSPLLKPDNPQYYNILANPAVAPGETPPEDERLGFEYEQTPPINILSIVYEVIDGIPVIPLDTNDIHYTVNNPFREPDENIGYRVTYDNKFDVLTSSLVGDYSYIYCQEPEPIILEDLSMSFGRLKVGGNTTIASSVLLDTYVINIIDIAVSLIVADYGKVAPKGAQPVANKGEQQQ